LGTSELLGRYDGSAGLHLLPAPDEDGLHELRRRVRRASAHRRGWLMRRMLLAADVAALFVSFLVVESVVGSSALVQSPRDIVVFVAALPGWALAAQLAGLYGRDVEWTDYSTTRELVTVFNLVTVGVWTCALAAGRLSPGGGHARIVAFWPLATVLIVTFRVVARMLCRQSVAYRQNALVVGAGEIGQLVARKLLQHPEYGLDLVGFVDTAPRERRPELDHLYLLGAQDRLGELVEELDVERVIVAFANERDGDTVGVVRALNELDRDVQVDIVPRMYELVGPKAFVHDVEGLPLVGVPPVRLPRSARLFKRALDIVGAATVLLLTAPFFAVVAVLIKRDSEGPVFFRQTRLGRDMRDFEVLKFRTMVVDTDVEAHRLYIKDTMSAGAQVRQNGMYKLDRNDSITRVGRWLRKTSLDELPQLINVLRGDMSLVGPRPCLRYETEYFEPYHFERFLVPAGVTGLWQVTARAKSTFGEALDMDVAYVRGWSLALDLRLLLRTPAQVLRPGATA
jgi:exopolysaccharide biosynthesis polyprenyl glycosylphosphotransferase